MGDMMNKEEQDLVIQEKKENKEDGNDKQIIQSESNPL